MWTLDLFVEMNKVGPEYFCSSNFILLEVIPKLTFLEFKVILKSHWILGIVWTVIDWVDIRLNIQNIKYIVTILNV